MTNVMRILDSTGDTQLSYDPEDAKALEDVERRFNQLMKDNFVAFDVTTQPGRVMTAFDPEAREIIVSHQFAGG